MECLPFYYRASDQVQQPIFYQHVVSPPPSPTSHGSQQEESTYGEEEGEIVDLEDSASNKAARDSALLRTAEILQDENRIKIFTSGKDRDLGRREGKPKINVNPDLSYSWLHTPEPTNLTDTHGLWAEDISFPTAKTHHVPSTYKGNPDKLQTACEDSFLEEFLQAPKLSDKNKILLPTIAFHSSEYNIAQHNPGPDLDLMLRGCIHENFVTDEVISMVSGLLSWLTYHVTHNAEGIPAEVLLKQFKDRLSLISDMTQIASQSNLRARNEVLATWAKNKVSLREQVLKDSAGPSRTQEVLKNTSLLGKSLFGEVPEHVRDELRFNVGQSLKLRLLRNGNNYGSATPSTSGASKRQATSQGARTSNAKRRDDYRGGQIPAFHTTQNDSTYKQGGFQDNQTPRPKRGAGRARGRRSGNR